MCVCVFILGSWGHDIIFDSGSSHSYFGVLCRVIMFDHLLLASIEMLHVFVICLPAFEQCCLPPDSRKNPIKHLRFVCS